MQFKDFSSRPDGGQEVKRNNRTEPFNSIKINKFKAGKSLLRYSYIVQSKVSEKTQVEKKKETL